MKTRAQLFIFGLLIVLPASGQEPAAPAAVQDVHNKVYNQDQNTKEGYQAIQVKSIQQLADAPAGAVHSSQTGIRASDLIIPQEQGTESVVPTTIITKSAFAQELAPASGPKVNITAAQAASDDFPLFAIARKEKPVTELRVDLRTLTPQIGWQKTILDNARAVAVVVERNKLHAVTDSIYQLDIGLTLGQQFRLCPGSPFLDQPVIGVGTAFILNRQTMVTANHVFLEDPDRYAIVFGFEMVNKTGAYEGLVSLKDIYYPTRIVQTSEILDVAVFEVSRDLDRPIPKYTEASIPAIYSSIYMIGHPYGLPKKVALNASIQSGGLEDYFYTTLFASQGNSGSPVFDMNTHQIIGVLVSGEIDYTWNGGCNSPSVCRIPYCKGEKVINIRSVPGLQELLAGNQEKN